MPGPPPKRDAERRRRNKPDVETITIDVESLMLEPIEIPKVDEGWHPVARQWYESLARSGQAVFYEPSDWATAYALAETLSRELNPQFVSYVDKESGETMAEWVTMPIKGSSLSAILKGMTSLMVTEGDRRRLSIELERKRARDEAAAAVAGVASISQQRQRHLAGGSK